MKVKSSPARKVLCMLLALLTLFAAAPLGVLSFPEADAVEVRQTVYDHRFPSESDPEHEHIDRWTMRGVDLLNGWSTHNGQNDGFWVHSLGDLTAVWCVEPGVRFGYNVYYSHGDAYWHNFPESLNTTLTGDQIRDRIEVILNVATHLENITKCFDGKINLDWKVGLEHLNTDTDYSVYSDSSGLTVYEAAQCLIWETVVGERDELFNHVDPHSRGKDAVQDMYAVGAVDGIGGLVDVLGNETARIENWVKAVFNESNRLHSTAYSRFRPGQYELVTFSDGKHRGAGGNVQDFVYLSEKPRMPTEYGQIKVHKTDGNGTDLAGAEFRAVNNDNPVISYTFGPTDAGGNAETKTNWVIYGTYTVTEIKYPAGYKSGSQTSWQVTVDGTNGSVAVFEAENAPDYGSCAVVKTSEDGQVEGISFTVTNGSDYTRTVQTDSSGRFQLDDLMPGVYTVTEQAYDKYVPQQSQTVTVKSGEVATVTFGNVLKKWTVTFTKTDGETGTAQGNASFAGARYGVYKGEELQAEYTTDENGSFTTDEYVCGDDWSIRETAPSPGYKLDPTVYHVGAEPGNFTIEHNAIPMTGSEDILKGKLAIVKHTDNGDTQIETPETGAVFEVYIKSAGSYAAAKESERDILVCDEDGFAQTKDLPYGTYTVHQTEGWEGREFIGDFDVYVGEEKVYRFLINNRTFESLIKIVKQDSETDRVIPYAGAAFEVYTPEGEKITLTDNYPSFEELSVFYTNGEGYLILPEKLPYGEGYYLVEVEAPYGYVLDSEPLYFDVKESDTADENGVPMIVVEKKDAPQKGKIRVRKTGDMFSRATKDGDFWRLHFVEGGLKGAVYEIYAAEDIVTPDGTLRYSKGDKVDTLTTGGDGTAASKELYLGKYEIREVTAPEGYVLNREAKTVVLSYAGQEVSVTEVGAEFTNARQKVHVTLKKLLEQDGRFGIGMNGELANVTFGLYAKEELTAADGTAVPADGLIEIVYFDGDGNGQVYTDLPLGKYYLKELTTDEHYLLDETRYGFEFAYAGQDTETVEVALNGGEGILNEMIRGSIRGHKVDEDLKDVEGAVFGLFRPDETVFTEETALLTDTTDEDGVFSFEDVPFGTWVIHEISPAPGFVPSNVAVRVTVSKDGQELRFTGINRHIYGNVEVRKTDAEHPETGLAGAEFEVWRDTDGDGKFTAGVDELLGLMTEGEGGVYRMEHLRFGKYLLHEKTAPEGYIPDEGYYAFAVTEDGATVTVENREGDCFVNEPMRGALKIVKTSSDGVVEGFELRVTGPGGYDETFVTDEHGEILLENLRIGKYTVHEEKTGKALGYITPADRKAVVQRDATTVVEMYNSLEHSPQTGDTFNYPLWLALAGASAAGLAVLIVLTLKKKKGTH